ncbi:transposase [Streptomyces noursei]|uniref:transposase n=1 Tax=Streptomyces noursei TaxID=1971 RepID=UPI0019CE343B|nr:transposase [Streptomyces noursei]MCZ1018996.1 transposase [Streptomyces noursei]GGX30740.1 hypothetical protein GCM10010341_60160 [Streptomyces noursei]
MPADFPDWGRGFYAFFRRRREHGLTTEFHDGEKKVPGRKRHIVTDCLALLLVVVVTAANIADRNAAAGLLPRLRRLHRDITPIWADGGYTGDLVDWCRQNSPSPCRSSSAPMT